MPLISQNLLHVNNPELAERSRITLKPPQLMRMGTRKVRPRCVVVALRLHISIVHTEEEGVCVFGLCVPTGLTFRAGNVSIYVM